MQSLVLFNSPVTTGCWQQSRDAKLPTQLTHSLLQLRMLHAHVESHTLQKPQGRCNNGHWWGEYDIDGNERLASLSLSLVCPAGFSLFHPCSSFLHLSFVWFLKPIRAVPWHPGSVRYVFSSASAARIDPCSLCTPKHVTGIGMPSPLAHTNTQYTLNHTYH